VTDTSLDRSFDIWGPAAPDSPVILSVPHAGRHYPAAMAEPARLTPDRLRVLEDRHVDAVARAALGGRTALVQRTARAWIDLNRSEAERDPAVDAGAPIPHTPSARLRSGLGLIPRRAGAAGEVWRRRLSDAEVRERIETAHRPYHDALAALAAAALEQFGIAVVLDVHSMPPLPGAEPARIVLGDRFGRAAAARYTNRAEMAATSALRVRTAINVPYPGGYVLDRHGAPPRGIHAIQVEFDRALYLDAAMDAPGLGLASTATTLAAIANALEEEALRDGARQALPQAAQ